MSEVLTKTLINCETGVVEVLPLTEEEISQREAEQAATAASEAERTAALDALEALKISARAKLVAGTPLKDIKVDTIFLGSFQ